MNKKIKVFEAFAGIGAQKKAVEILKKLGLQNFEIVATSEWDIWANISYNAMHFNNDISVCKNVTIKEMREFLKNFTHSSNGKDPISINKFGKLSDEIIKKLYASYKNSNNLGSILNIKAKDIIKNNNETIDMITYSFPCQDLSSAGKNKGMKSEHNTRSGLLWEIDRILKEFKKMNKLPKYLLLENVKNIIQKKHKDDFIFWINKLNIDYGYNTKTFLLNSNNYANSQKRERVFSLSIRENIFFTDEFKNNQKILSNNNKIKNIYFEKDFKKEKNKILNHSSNLTSALKTNYKINKYKEEAWEAIPNDTLSRRKIWSKNLKLVDIDKNSYVNTITTKQDRNPNAGNVKININNFLEFENKNKNVLKSNFRFLTPRETFILMGFSNNDFNKVIKNKSFISNEKLYRQAGNSIVVNVLVVIFYNIILDKWKEVD